MRQLLLLCCLSFLFACSESLPPIHWHGNVCDNPQAVLSETYFAAGIEAGVFQPEPRGHVGFTPLWQSDDALLATKHLLDKSFLQAAQKLDCAAAPLVSRFIQQRQAERVRETLPERFLLIRSANDLQVVADASATVQQRVIARLKEGIRSAVVPSEVQHRAMSKSLALDCSKPSDELWQDFWCGDYRRATRGSIGLSALPNGGLWYQFRLNQLGITEISPVALHDQALAHMRVEEQPRSTALCASLPKHRPLPQVFLAQRRHQSSFNSATWLRVLDTGIHAQGWGWEQAIAFARQQLPSTPESELRELILNMIAQPGRCAFADLAMNKY